MAFCKKQRNERQHMNTLGLADLPYEVLRQVAGNMKEAKYRCLLACTHSLLRKAVKESWEGSSLVVKVDICRGNEFDEWLSKLGVKGFDLVDVILDLDEAEGSRQRLTKETMLFQQRKLYGCLTRATALCTNKLVIQVDSDDDNKFFEGYYPLVSLHARSADICMTFDSLMSGLFDAPFFHAYMPALESLKLRDALVDMSYMTKLRRVGGEFSSFGDPKEFLNRLSNHPSVQDIMVSCTALDFHGQTTIDPDWQLGPRVSSFCMWCHVKLSSEELRNALHSLPNLVLVECRSQDAHLGIANVGCVLMHKTNVSSVYAKGKYLCAGERPSWVG